MSVKTGLRALLAAAAVLANSGPALAQSQTILRNPTNTGPFGTAASPIIVQTTGGSASLSPFKQSGSIAISPATSSSTVALASTATNNVLLVYNPSTTTFYGKNGASATTSDVAVPPGMLCSFDVSGATQFSTITASGTAANVIGWQGTGGHTGCIPYVDMVTPAGVAGSTAHASASPPNPIMVGAYATNSALSALSNGSLTRWPADINGVPFVKMASITGTATDGNGNTVGKGCLQADTTNTTGNTLCGAAQYYSDTSNWIRSRGDTTGAAVQLYGLNTDKWSYATAAGAATITNTTTAVPIKAAVVSVRNYVTACQISHDTLGGATTLVIRDGAGGTVLASKRLQTAANENGVLDFTASPLRGTANTLLEIATLTAVTGDVFVNCQGYAK